MSAADTPIPVPDSGAALAWAMDNPDALRAAVRLLNKLSHLQLQVLVGGESTIEVTEENALLTICLPIKSSTPIATPAAPAAYSATASATYSQSQIQALMDAVTAQATALTAQRTALAALLAELRRTGQLPP
jgi:hypothetical protein